MTWYLLISVQQYVHVRPPLCPNFLLQLWQQLRKTYFIHPPPRHPPPGGDRNVWNTAVEYACIPLYTIWVIPPCLSYNRSNWCAIMKCIWQSASSSVSHAQLDARTIATGVAKGGCLSPTPPPHLPVPAPPPLTFEKLIVRGKRQSIVTQCENKIKYTLFWICGTQKWIGIKNELLVTE